MHAITKPIDIRDHRPQYASMRQIEPCLTQQSAIRIEHAPALGAQGCGWQGWQAPRLHDGDTWRICRDIDRCRARHGDHYIRLCIDNHSLHCRISVLVHVPAIEA